MTGHYLGGGGGGVTRLRKRVGQEIVLENGDQSFTPFCWSFQQLTAFFFLTKKTESDYAKRTRTHVAIKKLCLVNTE